MKIVYVAIISLFGLLLCSGVQAQSTDNLGLLGDSELSLPAPDTLPTDETAGTPLIEDSLGLPLMRDQLTITESSADLSINPEEIGSDYGQMMQDFAANLDGYEGTGPTQARAPKQNSKLVSLITFIIEIGVTLIVLKVAFQFSDYRFRMQQILPICLIVAGLGLFLGNLFGLGVFNPARIGISFISLLVLIRLMTEVHDLSTALQMTLISRLVSLAIIWLAMTGMAFLLGL